MELAVSYIQELILGPPGCGKTTDCLRIVDTELSSEIRPDRILYSTFTKRGANEAIVRACEKFGFKRQQLPYFRTLHSLAFQELQLSREDVMQLRDYKRIGLALGLDFGYIDFEDGSALPTANVGDQMLYLLGLSRSKMITPQEQFRESDFEFGLFEFERFIATLDEYKKERGLYDFSDMIDLFIAAGKPLKIDVAIIDEAQDLSKQQWKMVRVAIKDCQRVYIAGDDDQAIFCWSGADVETFLGLDGDQKVLDHSYRLPRSVFQIAEKISSQISKRFPKHWEPRDDEGQVDYVNSVHDIDVREGTHLLLARNKYLLKHYEQFLRSEGLPYTTTRGSSVDANAVAAIRAWEALRKGKAVDVASIRLAYANLKVGVGVKRGFKSLKGATGNLTIKELQKNFGLLTTDIWHDALTELEDVEYYLAMLRRGEKLDVAPRIHISTIHAVKGGEADHVALMTDISWKTYQSFKNNPDDEHRVFYVGATRAKKTLQIIQPQTTIFYDVP
jgi:superfamily I DNA/RNA helicase